MPETHHYEDIAQVLKALSQPKRLQIVDMLSCGELCACEILEEFHITQPTLSHDMKVLAQAGIVGSRRDGKNTYYRLRADHLQWVIGELGSICSDTPQCRCHDVRRGEC